MTNYLIGGADAPRLRQLLNAADGTPAGKTREGTWNQPVMIVDVGSEVLTGSTGTKIYRGVIRIYQGDGTWETPGNCWVEKRDLSGTLQVIPTGLAPCVLSGPAEYDSPLESRPVAYVIPGVGAGGDKVEIVERTPGDGSGTPPTGMVSGHVVTYNPSTNTFTGGDICWIKDANS